MPCAITGAFCAGADLKERAGQAPADVIRFSDAVRGIIASLGALPVPVIAAVDGVALGGGAELALGADLRTVSSRASLGFPETGLGIIPGVGGVQGCPLHLAVLTYASSALGEVTPSHQHVSSVLQIIALRCETELACVNRDTADIAPDWPHAHQAAALHRAAAERRGGRRVGPCGRDVRAA